ncbi:SigE family RNA polymerase sigma factor [Krasilnikovia sp. MM14-A1259]|uniref:SigE family RNA polymerase sigma factor n=1 Tax=Krasilnikovia sp. MM14-A1259 TaxID=3373539 RepID=UPI00380325C7
MTFEDYVAQRGQSLLRLAYVLTSDTHLAEDVTQMALANVYRHWARVQAARDPDAYVRRVLVNAHLGWHRRRSATERPVAQITGGPVVADPADDVAARDRMHRLLAGLPPRARTVLVLRYYLDLDDAGIAEAMGISASTVRSTAARALAALRTDEQTHTAGEIR